MQRKIIGIGGYARSGKDTFATLLKEELEKTGKTVSIYHLGYELKFILDDFVKTNFGFSAFTKLTHEKAEIRNLFVTVADILRKRTKGTYFVKKLEAKLLDENSEYILIPDVRFAEYPEDEFFWIKKQDGKYVHVGAYTTGPSGEVSPLEAPNNTELSNYAKFSDQADASILWRIGASRDELLQPVRRFIHYELNGSN